MAPKIPKRREDDAASARVGRQWSRLAQDQMRYREGLPRHRECMTGNPERVTDADDDD